LPQAVSAVAHDSLRQLQGGKVQRPACKEERGTLFGCFLLQLVLSMLSILKPAAWARLAFRILPAKIALQAPCSSSGLAARVGRRVEDAAAFAAPPLH